ncbi:MAG: hypothetical protein ACRCV7_00080 [Culicoidibacterales bacterium]
MEKILQAAQQISYEIYEDKELVKTLYDNLKKQIEIRAEKDNIKYIGIPHLFMNGLMNDGDGYMTINCSLFF